MAAIGCNAQAFSDLPECGQLCVQNMLDKASELGCDSDDVGCLCQNPDFTYGIRDCSLEACTNDAQAIINYGAAYCKDQGAVVITTAQSSSNTGADATSSATGTDAASQSGVPIATSTHETVVEESGSSVTKTSVETLYSSSDASETTSGATESTSDATESTSSGASETTSDASASTGTADNQGTSNTNSESPAETDGDGDGDDDDSDSGDNEDGDGDENASARNAVGPAGLLAVAGVAAFLI